MALSPDPRDEVARMIPIFTADIGQAVPLTPEGRAAVERPRSAASWRQAAKLGDVRAKHGP